MEQFEALQSRPVELEALLNAGTGLDVERRKKFINHSMAYNSNLAFGQIRYHRAEDVKNYRFVKINNNIEYTLWDYNPPEVDKPYALGQLYTIPANQASARLNEIASNKDLKLDVCIALLFEIISQLFLANSFATFV